MTSRPAPARPKMSMAESLALAALLLLGGAVFLRHLPGPSTPVPKDFSQYWVAGKLALEGRLDGLYPVELLRGLVEPRFPGSAWTEVGDAAGLPETSYFIYAPWVAFAFAPLALLPPWAAFSVAYVLCWVALLLSFLLLPGLVPRHGKFAAGVSFLVLVQSPPFHEAAVSAQASLPLLLLVTLLARDWLRGNDVRAGLWWALATGLKLFPLLFLVYAVARGRRKMALAGIGFGALLALASVAVAGLDPNVRFARLILDHLPYVGTFESNQSVTGVLLRLFAGADVGAWTIVRVPTAIALTARVILLVTLAGTLLWIRRRARAGSAWDEAIAFALFLVWLFTTAPNAWLHHFVALAIPSVVLAAALRTRAEGMDAGGGVVGWCAAWALVLGHALFQRLASPVFRHAPWSLVASLPFFGAWTFYAALAGLLGRVPDAADSDPVSRAPSA